MNYIKEINLMTKSEMLMYIYLTTICNGEQENCKITRDDFERVGMSKTRFYEAKHNLMEKGILIQNNGEIYTFFPIKS